MALIKTLSDGITSGANLSILTSDRRNIYIEPTTVAELWPEVTPFTTDLYAGKLKRVTDPFFKMFEYRNYVHDAGFKFTGAAGDTNTALGTVIGTINGLAVNAEVEFTVGSYGPLTKVYLDSILDSSMKGYTFEIWGNSTTIGSKKHILYVNDVTSTAIKFKKIYTGDAIAVDDPTTTTVTETLHTLEFRLIGNAVGEGSKARDSWFNDIQTVWGATQKFNTTVEVTDDFIEGGVVLRGYENEFNRLVKDKAKEHKLLVERTLLYGASAYGLDQYFKGTTGISDPKLKDKDDKYIRTTKGLINELLQNGNRDGNYKNIFSIPSGYTYVDFVKDTEKIFQFAPQGYKKAYCGPGIMSYWAQIAMNGFFSSVSNNRSSITLSDMEKNKAGYNMKYLETPHGVLELVYTPALRGRYSNCMVIPSQEDLMLAEFKPLRYNTNIKTDDGYKGRKDEYYEEVGLGMNLIEKHAIMYLV